MTEKIRKMLSLILALSMLMFVFVPSLAEETADDAEEFENDDLYSFDDDYCGYVDQELILDHTPEMTKELVFADDYSEITGNVIVMEETPEEAEGSEEVSAEEVPETIETEPEEPEATEEIEKEAPATEADASEDATDEPEADDEATEADQETAETEQAIEADEATDEEATDEEATDEEATDEEATDEEAAADGNQISVIVQATQISENEMLLNAIVSSSEGNEFTFQWQISEDGGKHYTDIDDEQSDELYVILTDENRNSFWRVRVDVV